MPSSKNRAFFNRRATEATSIWDQVYRTIGGIPVDDAQIKLTVDAIARGLDLGPNDYVLDLCCGNGALSERIFSLCRGGVGVDFAENMIRIAREKFERPPRETYIRSDVEAFVGSTERTRAFTKAFCFFSFQLLGAAEAQQTLSLLRSNFRNIRRVFIGDLPDRSRMLQFFREGQYEPGIERDHEAPLGMWRTEDEFERIAHEAGWDVSFELMPPAYHAAHYRYNAILTA